MDSPVRAPDRPGCARCRRACFVWSPRCWRGRAQSRRGRSGGRCSVITAAPQAEHSSTSARCRTAGDRVTTDAHHRSGHGVAASASRQLDATPRRGFRHGDSRLLAVGLCAGRSRRTRLTLRTISSLASRGLRARGFTATVESVRRSPAPRRRETLCGGGPARELRPRRRRRHGRRPRCRATGPRRSRCRSPTRSGTGYRLSRSRSPRSTCDPKARADIASRLEEGGGPGRGRGR